jgi:predicted Zn-dependent peptidase
MSILFCRNKTNIPGEYAINRKRLVASVIKIIIKMKGRRDKMTHMLIGGDASWDEINKYENHSDAAEAMIDEIERLFEVYRMEKTQEKRNAIYRLIDSISYEASKLAIPNEYDKVMKHIGSQGTNAATSNDYTVYIENIPSNQLRVWAEIQADRFTHPVLRLFHTELETIYEEKNMSLTQDARKANDVMLAALFPNHPYGQQTTLGSQEHLKNPSLTNIKRFFAQYYVPNNMAICLSGDFDFDEAIAIIDEYFGALKPVTLPEWKVQPETPFTEPVIREVTGLEAENVRIAFRIDKPANSKEIYILRMLDNILANGKAGLIDLNLNQKQQVYYASASPYILTDNSAYMLYGTPKTGQTLDEVKDLLLTQIELLKKGEFDDALLQAAINNMKLNEMRQLENNRARVGIMANAFYNHIEWKEAALAIEQYTKVTKKEIVDFANQHFKNNYVLLYKRQGNPENVLKVEKPPITPIELNREKQSAYFKEVKNRSITPIEPVFVDFEKAITFDNYNGCPIYYLQNTENKTFNLTFRFKVGELNDLKLPIAMNYIDYLGTAKYSPETIKQLFYQYACNLSTTSSDDYSQIVISGLSDNFVPALTLTLHLIHNAIPNEEALQNMIQDLLKSRHDAKSNQNSVLNALVAFGEYGAEITKYSLSEEQLKQLKSSELIHLLSQLMTYQPEILYYGPESVINFKNALQKVYKTPKKFATPAPAKKFEMLPVNENTVLFAHYEATQSRLVTYSRSIKFDAKMLPVINMYNQYFGGGMNAIVFQEMREKRSLAYSASARYTTPPDQDEYMYNYSFIATQNDKIIDAFNAFNELFDQMPQSQNAFNLAKEGLKISIATNRITKNNILNTYIRNQRLGINYDYRKDLYEAANNLTLSDIDDFNQQYVKGKPKTYIILSNEKDVHFSEIEKLFGKVTKLSLKDIFGY